MSDAEWAGAPLSQSDQIDRPLFIVSTPRSGSTLFFETLAQAPSLFTIGTESHGLIENVADFAPSARGWTSNRLTAADARPDAVEALAQSFYARLYDRHGRPAEGQVRMLEKTPKNALRVPFFDTAWPDATFIYLYRDARQAMASMIEAWLIGRFRTYPRLPGWTGHPWSLLLVPGWEKLNGLPLPEIVAWQWAITTTTLIDDLESLPAGRVRALAYDELLASPRASMEGLATSLGLSWDRNLATTLPLSKMTVSLPRTDKWRAIERTIAEVWPIVAEADRRARTFLDRIRTR